MASGSRRERGAVAAEFAVILPILILLIFGIVQLGLAFQRFEAVNAAAREGARVASLPTSSSADVCTRVTSALSGTTFDTTPACSDVTIVGNCSASDPSVTVTVAVDNLIEIPFFGQLSMTLTGTGDFRCE